MDRTYFEEGFGGDRKRVAFSTRSVSPCRSLHLFSKTPAEVNLYGAAAPGKGGTPQRRVHVRIRACV